MSHVIDPEIGSFAVSTHRVHASLIEVILLFFFPLTFSQVLCGYCSPYILKTKDNQVEGGLVYVCLCGCKCGINIYNAEWLICCAIYLHL